MPLPEGVSTKADIQSPLYPATAEVDRRCDLGRLIATSGHRVAHFKHVKILLDQGGISLLLISLLHISFAMKCFWFGSMMCAANGFGE